LEVSVLALIENALISVSDKSGITEFSRALAGMGAAILSTGGTAKSLREAGVAVEEVSSYTGFPEIMDGRVKTLHPKIHGGLLARRDNPSDMETLKTHGIRRIDMVVVNLYPFEKTVARKGVTFEEAVENIDIGGPSMLRAAAKNFKDVIVIVDPADYAAVLAELKGGAVSQKTRFRLAQKVFSHTSRYDSAIAGYLAEYAAANSAKPA
jgi:phosphoribosylaminoimidazolecarboxamide formyltransferase/IMP cyclohydrolase